VFLAETHIGYESNIHRVGTFYLLKRKYKEYYLHCSIRTQLVKNKGGLKNQLILLPIKTVVSGILFLCNQLNYW
jgi:hypothetical protein